MTWEGYPPLGTCPHEVSSAGTHPSASPCPSERSSFQLPPHASPAQIMASVKAQSILPFSCIIVDYCLGFMLHNLTLVSVVLTPPRSAPWRQGAVWVQISPEQSRMPSSDWALAKYSLNTWWKKYDLKRTSKQITSDHKSFLSRHIYANICYLQ